MRMRGAAELLFNFGILPSEFLKKPKNEQHVDAAFLLAVSELYDGQAKGGR